MNKELLEQWIKETETAIARLVKQRDGMNAAIAKKQQELGVYRLAMQTGEEPSLSNNAQPAKTATAPAWAVTAKPTTTAKPALPRFNA